MNTSGISLDLKSRILPAIGFVLVSLLMLGSGPLTSMILMSVFAGLCSFELINMLAASKSFYLKCIGSVLWACICFIVLWFEPIPQLLVLIISTVGLVLYSMIVLNGSISKSSSNAFLFSLVVVVLPVLSARTMIDIDGYGRLNCLLILFLFIWCADTAAYFFGKNFGKHKIAPKISPNKSWEGLIGGLAACLLLAFVFSALSSSSFYFWSVFALIVVIFGFLGDLIESKLKRLVNLKDSGTLLGGHGGFLDRLDALLFAIPISALYLLYFSP